MIGNLPIAWQSYSVVGGVQECPSARRKNSVVGRI